MKNRLSGDRGRIFAALLLAVVLWYFVSGSQSSNIAAAGTHGVNNKNIFVEIVKKEQPAVVNIYTTQNAKRRPQRGGPFDQFDPNDPYREFLERFFGFQGPSVPRRSLGSGFIIDKEGYIFTNNHVVEKADEIRVKLNNGKEYVAKIVGTDPKTDLGLIKIEPEEDLPTVDMGDSDNLQVGEWVIAIGNPFGLSQTVTVGVISALARFIGQGPYDNFIQTDASINPGNSGGPLINIEGKVIGINAAILPGRQGGNIGIGFAIPINMAKNILEDLKSGKGVRRGWLGVVIQNLTPELAKALGLDETEGALVSDVAKDGPAEKAGIKQGDVITSFNGEKIKSYDVLPRVVASRKPGDSAEVVVLRNGKRKTFDITLGNLKTGEKQMAKKEGEEESEELGINVRDITPELARALKLKSEEGVVVVEVDQGGAAAKAGLRRGDIIEKMNHNETKNVDDFKEELDKSKDDEPILLVVRRGDSSTFMVIPPRKGEN